MQNFPNDRSDVALINLQSLIEHLQAGVVVYSPDTKILFANKEASILLGLTIEQLTGKAAIDADFHFVREDGTPLPLEENPAQKAISSLQYNDNYVLGIKKPGTEDCVWVLVNALPEFDNNNKLSQVIVTFVDISERKQMEFEIKILSEIVEGIVQTNDLFDLLKLIHSSLKKVLYAENCFFALFDQATGLFSFPYFVDKFDAPPQPQKMYKSCTQYIYRTRKSLLITPEIFEHLKNQNEIELIGSSSPSWIGVPLQTSSGIIGVLVLQHYEKENIYNERQLKFLDSIGSQVANIIERKRAENELEKSYSLVSATLESTADGILVVDKLGKITNFNKKFIELWQIPDAILATMLDGELLTYVLDQLKDPVTFLDKIKELYNNEDEISFDIIDFKDGRTFERYSQSQLFKGQSVGRVWSFRNITEGRKTLEALSESEARLHKLNATKDKFFSIISHDLKSPFNSIVGFSDILADQIRKRDYDNIEEYTEIIHQSSKRAMDLLTNLIEWSRSQSGYMEFNPEYIEIGSLINEVFVLSKVVAMQKTILLTKEIPQHITAFIDKNMIASVLRNLISNAIKFTHPGGNIAIKAEKNEGALIISVTDNGVGISAKDLNMLFRIDESFSNPGTQNEKGTGLGLILCKEFVDKHHGKIWVESGLGKGSCFIFTIPQKVMTYHSNSMTS
jgi:PAS domain S-box-containing protein